ncbi:MAG: cytochrome c [Gammaproteobacteria bacterium]|jgi:mono/diheme cytochrome c family protein|nr:cytochrome c [Gammaproteobacteria bacterium]
MPTDSIALSLAAALALTAAAAHAEPLLDSKDAVLNSGHVLYQSHCAGCHGVDGKGGSADSPRATVKVPDLTTLEQRHGGAFPFGELYDVISGSELLPAHGTRVMPIWGAALQAEPGLDGDSAIAVARGRILSIVAYLATLQAR